MEFDFFGHEKSWNLNLQKEYEPYPDNTNSVHMIYYSKISVLI